MRYQISRRCHCPLAIESTHGELLLFRHLLLMQGNPAPRADERCVPLHDQHVCVRTWPLKSEDWPEIASTLEELGAWSISERCDVIRNFDGNSPRSMVTDSGTLYVQRSGRGAFSGYVCNAPRLRTSSAGQRANAIYQYFLSLFGSMPYESDTIAR